jgi:hypothetical protein
MTEPDDGGVTRPISVAELLAKNGTIGAAPPGGRRRRRRGNSDAVTVAELTGEIPILRTGAIPVVTPDIEPEPVPEPEPAAEVAPEAPAEPEVPDVPVDTPSDSETPEAQDSAAEAVEADDVAPPADTVATNGSAAKTEDAEAPTGSPRSSHPELASEPTPRRGRDAAPERSNYPRPLRFPRTEPVVDAELMSPDPDEAADEELDPTLETDTVLDPDLDDLDLDETTAEDLEPQPDELGIGDASYLRATNGPLFGGQTVADDLARRGSTDTESDDADAEVPATAEALDDQDGAEAAPDGGEELTRGQLVLRGCWIALQSIVAVIFGAGLFIAFDQLWKWNNIVALVLSVLVILGLVVGVRVVRKTEDIASTLIAVAVGALVTLGPLALLQSN